MSVTTSLILNQDISPRNLRLPADSSGTPDMAKQQAWLKAMEQSQMQEWLRQGFIARGGNEAPIADGRLNTNHQSRTLYQDEVTKNSDRELDADSHVDAPSKSNSKQPVSTDVSVEKEFFTSDVDIEVSLPIENSYRRSVDEPLMPTMKSGDFSLKQLTPEASVTVFAQDGFTVSEGALLPSSANMQTLPVLPVDIEQTAQAAQAIKIALQVMTGLEVSIVSGESSNQITYVDKQTNQAVSRSAAGLSTLDVDIAVSEKSEIEEKSAKAAVTDDAETPPEEHDAIRFHAEWSEEGLRLWLGIDSNANVDRAQLTKQLYDWVTKQNVQLLALIWNGEQLPKNVIAQMLKDGTRTSALSQTGSKPGLATNISDGDDTHYFFNSYLKVKEMQWPSIQ